MSKSKYALGIALLALLLSVYPPGTSQAEDSRVLVRGSAVAAPGANTDFITDYTWKHEDGSRLRLSIQVATSSVVNLMVNDGTNEIDRGANSNTALVAGAQYEFDFSNVKRGDVINIQVETDSIIDDWSIARVK